jgi:hypothetical protein
LGTGGASAGTGGVTGSGGSGSGGTQTGSGGAQVGSGGSGTGGAPGGSGGRIGTDGGAGAVGDAAVDAGRSGDAGVGAGAPSLCPGSPFAVCQDFESTAVGATPAGNWGVPTTNYGTGATLAVASDDSARGSHSLKVTIPNNIVDGGSANGNTSLEQYLQLKNLGALASGHYGRLFVKIKSPTTSMFVHWDLILGAGQYNGSAVRVRWGNTGTGIGTADSNWAWIYNVEQGDFGTEARSTHPVLATWMCVEWQWDGTNQQARFYFQGTEVQALHIDTTLPGGSQSPEIPIFTSLSFGLAKYQNTDAPLVFWIDEIALDTQRIGCGN